MRRTLQLSITCFMLLFATLGFGQYWTEMSYFDGTSKMVQQVSEYDGNLIAFFYATGGVPFFGISSNGGSSFTEAAII